LNPIEQHYKIKDYIDNNSLQLYKFQYK